MGRGAGLARGARPRAGAPAAAALGGGGRGRVVWRRGGSAHLLLESGELVSLVPSAEPLHPWAVSAPIVLDPGPAAFVPGSVTLTLGSGTSDPGAATFALGPAEIADLRLRSRPARPAREGWMEVRRGAERFPPDDAFQGEIETVLRRFGTGGDVGALGGLLGLGEGLTPSGDDVLVGLLAGLDWIRLAAPETGSVRPALAAMIRSRALASTTRLSAQIVLAAGDGLYPEPVLDVLEAAARCVSCASSLRAHVARLASIGHGSGREVLRGIAAGLERGTPSPPEADHAVRAHSLS